MTAHSNCKNIYDVFRIFKDPPEGTKKFFEYCNDNVHWQVTDEHRFSGTWITKKDYYNPTGANINLLLSEPRMNRKLKDEQKANGFRCGSSRPCNQRLLLYYSLPGGLQLTPTMAVLSQFLHQKQNHWPNSDQ